MTVLLVQPEDQNSAIQAFEFFAAAPDMSSVFGLGSALNYLQNEPAHLVLFTSSSALVLKDCQKLLDKYPNQKVAVALPSEEIQNTLYRKALQIGLVDVLEVGPDVSESPEELLAELLKRLQKEQHDLVLAPVQLDLSAEQARELEHDQQAGKYIQSRMLPATPMSLAGYRLSHKVLPTLYLSGDFVDYFRITDQHFLFYMADVSGHGAGSAFVTVLLKNFASRLLRDYTPEMLDSPGQILVMLNQELIENRLDKHVSIFIGVVNVDESTLSYSNAGHFPHAMLVGKEDSRFIEMNGKPVGLFKNVNYASDRLALEADIQLVLVSDGILEILPGENLERKELNLLEKVYQAKNEDCEIWDLFDLPDILEANDDISFLTVSKLQ